MMLKFFPRPVLRLISHQKFNNRRHVEQRICGFISGPRNIRLNFSDARLIVPTDSRFASVELVRRDEESSPLRIPLVWLRDHCRTASCYNPKTNQRRSNCTELFKNAMLAEDCYPINFDAASQQLRLFWADGNETCFAVSELLDWALFDNHKNAGEEHIDQWEASKCPSRTLWTSENLKEVPTVSSQSFDFAVFARLFVRFGVVCVSDVHAGDERATRELCQSIAPIHSTFFGDFWTFGTDQQQSMAAFDDTAYGNEGIGPHTDGTYMDQSPGVQVFHCLKPANHGGDTYLVDGFAVADRLKAENAKLFRVLAETTIEHHYLEGLATTNSNGAEEEDALGVMMMSEKSIGRDGEVPPSQIGCRLHARSMRDPVIRLFAGDGEKIAQIRFNPYDRAPMRTLRMDEEEAKQGQMAFEQTVLFYEAYERFAQLANQPKMHVLIRLRPGQVLFVDNFRVLHARHAFQGDRTVCGCYLVRDCLLARARPVLSHGYYKNV